MAKPNKQTKTGVGGAEVEVAAEGKEAVVAEVKGVNTTPESPTVMLDVNVPVITAAESTEVTVKVRRNGIAGAVVAEVTEKPGASAKQQVQVQAEDEPGEVAGMTYVVTLTDVAKKQSKSAKATIQAVY